MSNPSILNDPLEASYHEVASGSYAPEPIQTAGLDCHVCSRNFQSRDSLVKHFKKHTKEFFCRKCTQAFDNKESLENHNTVKHGQEYLCTVCGKTLHGKKNYMTHLTIHDGKPFSCPFCGKKFLTQKILTDHINVHTGLQPYGCSTCGAEFSRSANLSRHQMSCGRSLSCPICKKDFTNPSMLTDHKQTEHSKKVFQCPCGKKFKWRPSLSRHKKQCNYAS